MKTSISIITGYLGAGKTTLLKRIIDNLDRKFAIIMNEFGEIGIDTQIIQGKNINIAELAGGCVCCSLTGEFEDAVKEIRKKYQPEIIIVETTGVAEPDAIIVDVSNSIPDIVLDSVITVADADALVRFPTLGRTGTLQLEIADLIILNKIDLVNESQRVDIKTRLRQINKKAPIIETTHCNVDIDILFSIEVDHHLSNAHGEHHHNVQSFTHTFTRPLNRDAFEQFLLDLPPQVYRLKGFVQFEEDDTYLLNYVAGRWEFEPMASQSQELVFIGENIQSLKPLITKKLSRF